MTDLLQQARELREKLQNYTRHEWMLRAVFPQQQTGEYIAPVSQLRAFLDAVIEHLEKRSAVEYIEYDARKDQRTHTLAIMATILAVNSQPDAKFDSIAAAEVMLAEVEKRGK